MIIILVYSVRKMKKNTNDNLTSNIDHLNLYCNMGYHVLSEVILNYCQYTNYT